VLKRAQFGNAEGHIIEEGVTRNCLTRPARPRPVICVQIVNNIAKPKP
jgi:hypothetical protein